MSATTTGPSSRGTAPPSLPNQLTSFVGREREAAEISRLLAATQLLTLTGARGSGKTRLALHVAGAVRDRFRDGVRLVDLHHCRIRPWSRALWRPRSACASRRVPTCGRRSEHLRTRDLCMVIDNSEHLIAAVAALVEDLLRSCPLIRVLVTSREPLGAAGETIWRVPSLTRAPQSVAAASLERLSGYEGVRSSSTVRSRRDSTLRSEMGRRPRSQRSAGALGLDPVG